MLCEHFVKRERSHSDVLSLLEKHTNGILWVKDDEATS